RLVPREVAGIREPLDRPRHATLEALQAGVGRGPAQQPSRLVVAGAQPLHLALLRAQALLVGHDFDLCAYDVGDHAGCIANRDLEAAAQFNDFPDAVAGAQRGDKARHGISHVAEIARRMHCAEANPPPPGGDLGDHRREMQDGVAVLHRGTHAVRVPDVAREHLEMAFHLRRAMVEPAPRIERVVENEGADRLAGPNEGFRQVGPNETIGTGDQDSRGHFSRDSCPSAVSAPTKSDSTVRANRVQLNPSSIFRLPAVPYDRRSSALAKLRSTSLRLATVFSSYTFPLPLMRCGSPILFDTTRGRPLEAASSIDMDSCLGQTAMSLAR